MRLFILLFLALNLALSTSATAQRRGKIVDHAEQGHLYQIVECLQRKDAPTYVDLFPDMDTLSKLIMESAPQGSAAYRQMQMLQDVPTLLVAADMQMRAGLKDHFDSLILRGEALGISWRHIQPLRFELEKMRRTRDTVFEKIMPDRYTGYVFMMDVSARQVYALTVSDIMQIHGEWYGGQVRNIYEARSKDEYLAADAKARKKYGTSDIIIPEYEDDENPNTVGVPNAQPAGTQGQIRVDGGTAYSQVVVPAKPRAGQARDRPKIVLEKHFYTGLFDDEVPVQLYVHYLKGDCPEKACLFDAMYKFGDEEDYILLSVTRTPDGKWTMVEDKNNVNMELTLAAKEYTGMWLNNSDGTGYDALLKEKDILPDRVQRLDATMQRLKATAPVED